MIKALEGTKPKLKKYRELITKLEQKEQDT